MKKPWLFRLYMGIVLGNYMGILISQYKDPYKPTSIMESRRDLLIAQITWPMGKNESFVQIPDAQCMAYLPTFG